MWAGPVPAGSVSVVISMPLARRDSRISLTSVNSVSCDPSCRSPGLNVRMLPSNIPWNRPIVAPPLTMIR